VAKEVFDEALNPLSRVCFIRETLVDFVATENIIIVFFFGSKLYNNL